MAKRPVVPALVLVGLSLPGIACREEATSPEARQMGELPRGERGAEAILDRGEHHEHSLRLQPDEAVHAVVEQRGIDALVEVIDPAGDVVLTVDGPIDDYGFEHVCFVAKDRGPHRLRVRAWVEDAAGPYSIRLVAQRPATPQDRACTEATRAFAAAEQQRQETGRASEELLAAYQRALELWRRAEEPYPLAVTLKQTGRVFSGLGDLQAEIRCYEEALPLLHLAGDPRQEGAVLNLRGLVYRRLGDPDLARSSFEEALGIAQQTGDRRGEGTALSNLALWEVASGEIHRAIELYQQCLEIWGTLGRRYQEATTLHNLGSAYSRLGRFAEALDALEEAREVRQEIGGRDRLATTWLAIGWVEHLSGDGEAAAERFRTAIELYREAGSRLGEAAAHDRLGSAYRRLGRSGDAFDAYRTGLEIYREAGDRANTAHAASNLGCLLGELRRWEEAREALGEARELFETLGERAGLAHVRFCEARVERGDGDPEAALRSIEEALALVDALRSSALRQGHRFPALGLWQDYSELYVELLMMLHEREPGAGYDARAFEVSDLARARRLYQMLLESRVDVRSGVPEELLERERAVQRRLNAVELRRQSLLARGAVKEEVAEVDRTLRGLLLELEDVWVAIRSASPRFAELRQPSPVRLAELRQLLEPGTLLLSYVLAEERSFLFLVSRDRLSSYVLPGRRRLERLARRFYHGLRASDQRRTRLQKRTNATVLSETLVGPIGDELGSHRLLVVGDGMLHYVPFAALPLPAAGESKELLIDRYEVVHLPSAAVMKALRQRAAERAAPSKTLAVLADPVCSPQDDRLPERVRNADPQSDGWGPSFRSLPSTRLEAESILAMVSPQERLAALDFAASPELVKSGELRDYRILHFATHGLLDEVHPELSGVVLSLFDEHGRRRDGHLRLHEIYALQLPADLVVLSACRTALGRRVRGEGLVGLTHGFFYAGASRLLVSLWNVHDEATAELMTAFYRGLLMEGLSPPSALRAAQVRMRRQQRWRAAYYWAGFVLEGDWR